MSSRLPPQPVPNQLDLLFEKQRGDDARTREFYCEVCRRWITRELYNLFHASGHPPRPF